MRQLRATLSGLRLTGLTIGRDGRNRCLLSPFASITGRNQPSNSKFIFGPAKWMRHLIKPPDGYGVAYLDWQGQEIAIAAGLSGDERMIAGILAGDPYMSFLRDSALAPPDATKATHGPLRERAKVVVLGVLYGTEATLATARHPAMRGFGAAAWHHHLPQLLALTKRQNRQPSSNRLASVFGWPVQDGFNEAQLANFPDAGERRRSDAAGGVVGTRTGIEVCGDPSAFLIGAPVERLEDTRMSINASSWRGCSRIPVNVEVVEARWPFASQSLRGWRCLTK